MNMKTQDPENGNVIIQKESGKNFPTGTVNQLNINTVIITI